MSEGQGTATASTGNAGNSAEGQGTPGKVNDRVAGGHPKIKRALGVDTSGASSAKEAGKNASTTGLSEGASSAKADNGGNPGVAGETKPEVFNNKLKLKVQGREIELDLNDPNDRREAQRRLQMDVAAEQRMHQASQREKQIASLLDLAERDPWAAAEHLAKMKNPNARLDRTEFAKNIIAEQIKNEMMDPHQRALMEERAQREAIQRQLEDRNQKDQAFYQEQLKTQKAQKWEADIIQALDVAKVPKTPIAVRMMAQNLLDAKSNGLDVTTEEAAHYTRRQIAEGVRELIKDAEPAEIEKIFGKEVIDKIISYQVEKVRAPLNQGFANKPSLKPDVSPERPDRKWRDWNEVRDIWDKRAKT